MKSANYIRSQCVKCRSGFYSLHPNMECTICVDNAVCIGGNSILPISGYWRLNENSSKILKCANINLCPDQNNFLQTAKFIFVCGNGSFGNLCADCDDGYGLSSDKSCLLCRADVKVIILAIFNFFVLVYQSFVVFNFTRNHSISRSLLKLMVNHTNYVTLLSVFSNMIFSDNLNTIMGLKDTVSTIGTITDSTIADCLINKIVSKENLVIARIAIFSFFPLIVFLLLCIVRFCFMIASQLIRKNQTPDIKLVLISCLILVIYSFYPKLVYNTFTLIKCIPLDDTERFFLEIDPNIQCWQSDHYKYLFSIFLPNLLLYCVGWPILLFSMLYRKKVLSVRKVGKLNSEYPFFGNSTFKESVTSILKDEKKEENALPLPLNSSMLKSKKLDYSIALTEKQEDDIFQKDKMYSYITIDYAHNTYYWDTFFFGSNLILISVSVVSTKIHPLIYIVIIMAIFSIMLMIFNQYRTVQIFRN